MKLTFTATKVCCRLASVIQALICNFAPLLYVIFQTEYRVGLSQLAYISTLVFFIQLLVELFCPVIFRFTGYRRGMIYSMFLCSLGLVLLALLPDVIEPYAGILIAVFVYSVGAGLLEVVVLPIAEGCPGAVATAPIPLQHSFYSWGQVVTVLLTTLVLGLFGKTCWKVLSLAWAVLPFINGLFFFRVPIVTRIPEDGGMPVKALISNKRFIAYFVMMLCAGAAEMAIAQWASAFAELSLGVSKTLGDILGPCMFACLLGASRTVCGLNIGRINLRRYIILSMLLCAVGYILIVFCKNPALVLLGCALSGYGVGIGWPGTVTIASEEFPLGGSALFSVLSAGGALGCSVGAAVVGLIADASNGNFRMGILAALVFPLLLAVLLFRLRKERI